MNTNEPTTGEIVRALRCSADDDSFCKKCQYGYALANAFLCDRGRMNGNAADRLESQEQTISALTARAEQAEAREKAIIRCSECARLDVISSDIVYAQCKKYAFVFFPFEADTRETGCTHGERGLPQEGEGERCRVEF